MAIAQLPHANTSTSFITTSKEVHAREVLRCNVGQQLQESCYIHSDSPKNTYSVMDNDIHNMNSLDMKKKRFPGLNSNPPIVQKLEAVHVHLTDAQATAAHPLYSSYFPSQAPRARQKTSHEHPDKRAPPRAHARACMNVL